MCILGSSGKQLEGFCTSKEDSGEASASLEGHALGPEMKSNDMSVNGTWYQSGALRKVPGKSGKSRPTSKWFVCLFD